MSGYQPAQYYNTDAQGRKNYYSPDYKGPRIGAPAAPQQQGVKFGNWTDKNGRQQQGFTSEMSADEMYGTGNWAPGMVSATAPRLNSLQTYGLGQGSAAAGRAGSFTANAAPTLQGLMNPNASTGPADNRGFAQMMESQRNQLNQLRGMATQNAYRKGGTAYTATMNNALSRPSGMLQNALQNTQRSAAERGITLGSGLTQQMLNSNRNDAAKMAAQLGGQVDQDFAIREAEQDERNRQFLAELAQLEGNLGTQGLNNQLAQMRLAMQQDEMQYGRRNDAWRDPLARAGAELGLAGQQAQFDYLRPTLEQQYQAGQQRLDLGQLGLELQRAVQSGQITAENARNALAAADANAMRYATDQEDQFQRSGLGQFYANYDRAQRNPIQRDINNAIGQLQQVGMGFLGMGAGGGFTSPKQAAPIRMNVPSTLGVQWPY